MCSVGDDNLDEKSSKYMLENPKLTLLGNKCNKCRENKPNVVLRSKDVYCKTCFLNGTTHKFKAFLGKHKFVYPNDNVLVYHKLGHPSTALLHFLRAGLDLTTPKKLRFQPIFIYIDDYDSNEGISLFESAKTQVAKYNFPFYYISLSNYAANQDIAKHLHSKDVEPHTNDKNTINNVIRPKANETNKKDILKIFERQILLETAKELDCKCIFTPELGIDIASQLLTNVSLGRGIHLPLDVGICDDRDPGVKIIRPLRHFEIKELALYNYFHNLEIDCIMKNPENIYSSVQSLMKNFVSNLQNNFPATITTIVRTGDKLAMDKDLRDNDKCTMCKAPRESVMEGLSSAESTNFSHWVSTQIPDYTLTSEQRYQKSLQSFKNSQISEYCFACHRLSKDLLNK